MDLNIVIIASGLVYQQAAACSAFTYVQTFANRLRVTVLLPEGETVCDELMESHRIHGFSLRTFPFVPVSDRKFTSQLKCQAYLHGLSLLSKDEVALFADADTCCLKPVSIRDEIIGAIQEGRIGMTADIEDRHFKSPEDPWYLTEKERVTYVNSGVIVASRNALPMFRRFRSLSEEERFLYGPFNDQKVINFALGKYFRDRLVLLEKKYNWIGPPFSRSALIAHFAGGAGYLGQQRRKEAHRRYCLERKKGSGVWTA